MAVRKRQVRGPAGPRQRILRIGVILGGNIVEERLVRNRETISIGQSSKNTFSVPIEGLPKTWPLFSAVNGVYHLEFTDQMNGRISDGKGVKSLDSLKRQGATRKPNGWSVRLAESSRGKIVLGDMTLLFQFVTAPPLQPRPRLPASVRGTLADRVDPQLAIIMAISIIAHFSVALYAYQRDQALQTRLDKLHGEYEQETFKERTITRTFDMPTEGTSTIDEGAAEEPAPEDKGDDTPKTKSKPKDTGDRGNDNAPDDAAIREAIANTAFLKVATGGEAGAGRYDEMNNTDQGAGLDKAIKNVKQSGGGVATRGRGDAGDRRSRGPQSGKVGTGKGPRVGNVGSGTTVAVKKEEKVSRVKVGGAVGLDDSGDPAAVARRIRSRYLAGIKRCHQRVLKQDPKAGGKVTIRFTLGPTGNVTKSSVKAFDPTVGACIKSLTKKWRFGKQKGNPQFAIPLILKPGN